MASTQPKRLRPRNNFGDEAYEKFICEAYGCKPFEISVVKLSTAAIDRIKMEIKDQNKMHNKKTRFMQNVAKIPKEYPPVNRTTTPRVLSRAHTRVPLPVRNIVVRSMNHECRFCKKLFPCFSIWNHNHDRNGESIRFFFLVHKHQIRIQSEHSYSASPFEMPQTHASTKPFPNFNTSDTHVCVCVCSTKRGENGSQSVSWSV